MYDLDFPFNVFYALRAPEGSEGGYRNGPVRPCIRDKQQNISDPPLKADKKN